MMEGNAVNSDNNFVLTAEIVSVLKCSLCQHYLSVPPVNIISEDGTKYKCGRCIIKTHINTRAIMYENLAKYMTFPCIYKNCPEKLLWKDVKEHEKKCTHRTIKCITLNCEDVILMKDFLSHFKEKHNKLIFTDSVSINNLHNSYGLCILEKEDICFIVCYDYDKIKFGVNICAFQPHNKQFELRMSSTGSNHSILFKEQNISVFDERIHCYKCLKGTCKSEFHVYSYYSKGFLKHMTTKFQKDIIRRTFGSKDVICAINIIDKKEDAEEELNLDDILLGKEVIIDEVNDEEDNEIIPEEEECDILKELMKCPSCKEIMIPPIHQCITGHTLCGECKNKFENCTICETTIANTRNYVLEEVAANLKLSNQNEVTQTPESLNKEMTCPLSKCFDKVTLSSISNHFKENHISNFHFNNFSIKNVYAYYNVDVLVKNDKIYLVLFDFDDINFGISICSLDKVSHQYEVTLSSANGKFSITVVGQKIIMFNEKEHCFKCSLGTCKNSEHTFRTKRKEVFRRLTTKINRDCVRRVFGSNSMNYKINIIPAKNTTQKDKILRQMFECPICKDYMLPPIHQCVAGHTLCSACKSKLEKCPSCESKIDETRNYVIEDIADKVELPCQYESENCTFRAGVKRVASHELECLLKNKKVCMESANS